MNKPLSHLVQELQSISLSTEHGSEAPCHRTAVKRIVLVIPGRLFRNGIELVLRDVDSHIVGDFETIDQVGETLTSWPDLRPDLLIVGINDLGRAAEDFAQIRALRAKLPEAKWIVLSNSCAVEFWRHAIESSVDAMLQGNSAGEVLQLLVKLVLRGYSFLPAWIATALSEGLSETVEKRSNLSLTRPRRTSFAVSDVTSVPSADGAPRWHSGLSDRESDILRGLVAGQSNKAIARDLNISEATVKVHVKALLRKMQVTNRTQAAISALQFLHSPARTIRSVPPLTLVGD